MKKKPENHADAFERAANAQPGERYILRLFVAGITPKSERAIRSVKEVCEQYLKGRYDLEIVDIYQRPEALKEDQVVVALTLIKKLPEPLRRLIGDMTDREKILVGLNLKVKP